MIMIELASEFKQLPALVLYIRLKNEYVKQRRKIPVSFRLLYLYSESRPRT